MVNPSHSQGNPGEVYLQCERFQKDLCLDQAKENKEGNPKCGIEDEEHNY